MNWSQFWEKHRVRISQGGGLFLFFIAHPRSQVLFSWGLWLALLGEALRIWSAGHIRKGATLAQTGPYAMVRNPLYLGSLTMACGFALMCTSGRHWFSSLLIWGVIYATFRWLYAEKIALEEADLASVFGPEFDAYRGRVPAMWPDWDLLPAALRSSDFTFEQLKRNKEHKTVLALLLLAAVLRFKMIYLL